MSEDNNKIFTKQMSYECRKENGKDFSGHLEGVCGGGGGRSGGKRRSGNGRKGEFRVVASADAGDSDELRGGNTGHRKAKGGHKAFEAAMAWLFNPESNPDAWMLSRVVTRDWAGNYIH